MEKFLPEVHVETFLGGSSNLIFIKVIRYQGITALVIRNKQPEKILNLGKLGENSEISQYYNILWGVLIEPRPLLFVT